MLEQQEAQEAKDTWYPQHRNCNCCKGFIHGAWNVPFGYVLCLFCAKPSPADNPTSRPPSACPSPMCADLGVCGCTLEDDDIQQAGDAES